MERFFAVGADDELRETLAKCWELSNAHVLKAINTNYPKGIPTSRIELVIALESPSNTEIECDLPAVADTGFRVFRYLCQANGIAVPFSYRWLAANGYYLTNIVRYQADYGNADTKTKYDRLSSALELSKVREQFIHELQKIHNSNNDAKVLFACGVNHKLLRQIVTYFIPAVTEIGMPWFGTTHPSRPDKKLIPHYDPSQWGNGAKLPRHWVEALRMARIPNPW